MREAGGWAVTGNYHAYTYGPERDGEGQLWVTLNVGHGRARRQSARLARLGWHGRCGW